MQPIDKTRNCNLGCTGRAHPIRVTQLAFHACLGLDYLPLSAGGQAGASAVGWGIPPWNA